MIVSGAFDPGEASPVIGLDDDAIVGERTLRKAMWRLLPLLGPGYAAA